jgi:glycosyltransferase involved in cell wall biosynthesis
VWAWQAPDEQGHAISAVSLRCPATGQRDSFRPTTALIVCEKAIQSVIAQTYQDFEIVVVNDGTVDVSEVVAPLNKDGRITTIRHDRNRGLAAARNTGLRAAKGTYIAYLDDDDTYLPDHLETLVTALQSGEHKVVYTDAWRIHEARQGDAYVVTGRDMPYSKDFNCIDLLVYNYIPVLCVMHEKACLEQVGVFDESLFAHEDWDLWIRMATLYPFLPYQEDHGRVHLASRRLVDDQQHQ